MVSSLTVTTMKKRGTRFGRPFCIWEAIYTTSEWATPRPTYRDNWEFQLLSEKLNEKAMQQVQVATQAALAQGPMLQQIQGY